MEPFDLVHFVVSVSTGSERWEGNGFYAAPQGAFDWSNFGEDVARAIQGGLAGIVDCTKPFRFSVEGDRYIVHGPLAEAMRKRVKGRLRDDSGCFTWEPLLVDRYVLGKGVNRG